MFLRKNDKFYHKTFLLTQFRYNKITCQSDVKEAVTKEIKNRIIEIKSVTFYLGGYGDFDILKRQGICILCLL